MFPAFAIPSMTVQALPYQGEDRELIATFSVEFGPVLLNGLRLARMDSGELRLQMPRAGRASRTLIRGQNARNALLALACNAYRALTGRDPAEMPVAKASPNTDTFHEFA